MRIESGGDNRVGAIMVKFNSYEKKREVFRGISLLKKTGYSLKEDLTPYRANLTTMLLRSSAFAMFGLSKATYFVPTEMVHVEN